MQSYDRVARQWWVGPKIDEIIRVHGKMGDHVPRQAELGRRHQLIMFNYDLATDTPEQLSANMIPVGGLQIRPARPLPADLEDVMAKSGKGVILFSLGTNVPVAHLGDRRFTDVLNAFAAFPDYTFVCKIEVDRFPIPLPSNVVVRKWLAQNDVLGIRTTKLSRDNLWYFLFHI